MPTLDVIRIPGCAMDASRDRIRISRTLSLSDLEGTIGEVVQFLVDLDAEMEEGRCSVRERWSYESDYTSEELIVEGWRQPTKQELTLIEKAWAKEDARRQRERQKEKQRQAKAKADKEAHERKEYERLQKKFNKL